MNQSLKRLSAGTLAACLLTSGAFAAQITPSVSNIQLDSQENTVSFDIRLEADEQFAGAEFGIRPSASDVQLSSITYLDGAKNEATVKTVKDGVLYFGFFAGDNRYGAGSYDVARVTYTYSGSAPRTIALDSSKIVTIDEETNQTVGDTTTEPFTVRITRAETGGGAGGDTGGGAGGGESGGSGSGGQTRPVKPSEPSVVPPAVPSTGPVFTDVNRQDYYYDAVYWAVENGITLGLTDTLFAPGSTCTRAQMVTFLWRAAGCPQPASMLQPFTDMAPDAYYAKAVLWAVEQGITQGRTAQQFDPDGLITRQQAVTLMWRAAGSPAMTPSAFTDVPADAYYASAVSWALQRGITKGVTATTFSPAAPCTRGNIVTFLYRNTLA